MRQENIEKLSSNEYDLLVVGGGIFGATAVWEASLRGMKAALIEATDFSHGSSANPYKIIHGGIRYMQHADIPRVLSSARERSAFLRIAPHLCKPLPIMIPTYGYGKLGKPFLGAGSIAFDCVTAFRNIGIKDKSRQIPATQFLNKEQVLGEFPHLDAEGLTGACVFNDGRFYNPTRLVWAFIQSAMHRGAHAANYVSADELILEGNAVVGVKATDRRSGEQIDIRSKCVLNTAGPWAERWLSSVTQGKYKPEGVYSRDACFVVKRRFESDYTLAVQGESADPDALLAREKRHLFLAPWREYTLIGVWHKVTDVKPEDVTVSDAELEMYIEEINGTYPHLQLTVDDVVMWNAGLVPFGEEQSSEENLSYGKRSNMIDHSKTEGLENFVSLIGLRYTMARGETEKALSLVQKKMARARCAYKSDFIKLESANFGTFDQLKSDLQLHCKSLWPEQVIEALAHNYGSDAFRIVDLALTNEHLCPVYENTTVTAAEIEHVCREEMVETFSDVVFRRTDAATGGNPGDSTLSAIMAQVAAIKGWDAAKCDSEIDAVKARLR